MTNPPPLPAGSIIDPDKRPDPLRNFLICDECDSASVCASFDSCGRGKPHGKTPAPTPRVTKLVG